MSAKVAGDTASLTDPAVDRIFDFAGDVGMVALIHEDIDMPFAKQGTEPAYLAQMKAPLKRHPKTTTIWAHTGLGRVIHLGAGRLRRRGAPPESGGDRPPDTRRSGSTST